MVMQYRQDRVLLRCIFPMPYIRSARIELQSNGTAVQGVRWVVRYEPFHDSPNQVGYFHATIAIIPRPSAARILFCSIPGVQKTVAIGPAVSSELRSYFRTMPY